VKSRNTLRATDWQRLTRLAGKWSAPSRRPSACPAQPDCFKPKLRPPHAAGPRMHHTTRRHPPTISFILLQPQGAQQQARCPAASHLPILLKPQFSYPHSPSKRVFLYHPSVCLAASSARTVGHLAVPLVCFHRPPPPCGPAYAPPVPPAAPPTGPPAPTVIYVSKQRCTVATSTASL
jgi:hypothetical protein